MGNKILFWSIGALTIVPALLVASGYWNRGVFITTVATGAGLAMLLWFNESVISALVVIVVTLAGLKFRPLDRIEPISNPILWSKSLLAALFCGIVGGALFAVLDSIGTDKPQRVALPSDSVVSEGTSFVFSRLFGADMLLLWIIAVVAVIVWKTILPTQQNSTPTVQSNHQSLL